MAKITIFFDAGPLIRELQRTDIKLCFKNISKDSELLKKIVEIEKEWKIILSKIDKITKEIAERGVSKSLESEAQSIVNHCHSLGCLAGPLLVEGGSFVPGPVGIVCSMALAIVDFSIGNYYGGFMNLLGCIPFAKAGVKAAKPLLNDIIKGLLKNPEFVKYIKNVSGAVKPAKEMFTRKIMPEAERIYRNLFPGSTYNIGKSPVKPNSPHVGNYGKTNQGSSSIQNVMQHNSQKTGTIKTGKPSQYGPDYFSISYEEFILKSNTGKFYPYSHLGF